MYIQDWIIVNNRFRILCKVGFLDNTYINPSCKRLLCLLIQNEILYLGILLFIDITNKINLLLSLIVLNIFIN